MKRLEIFGLGSRKLTVAIAEKADIAIAANDVLCRTLLRLSISVGVLFVFDLYP